ncbi:unnamed protein product [Heligmosomoides polygyrus]|uniref:Piwi domain-containing protein n=1 Tax=Heligmosomoides polygyrus TaxID=6339 RepID=A0A183GPC8_HELPZ|nr:unnamed protein product [Heligmosomoides polygyrus]
MQQQRRFEVFKASKQKPNEKSYHFVMVLTDDCDPAEQIVDAVCVAVNGLIPSSLLIPGKFGSLAVCPCPSCFRRTCYQHFLDLELGIRTISATMSYIARSPLRLQHWRRSEFMLSEPDARDAVERR